MLRGHRSELLRDQRCVLFTAARVFPAGHQVLRAHEIARLRQARRVSSCAVVVVCGVVQRPCVDCEIFGELLEPGPVLPDDRQRFARLLEAAFRKQLGHLLAGVIFDHQRRRAHLCRIICGLALEHGLKRLLRVAEHAHDVHTLLDDAGCSGVGKRRPGGEHHRDHDRCFQIADYVHFDLLIECLEESSFVSFTRLQ